MRLGFSAFCFTWLCASLAHALAIAPQAGVAVSAGEAHQFRIEGVSDAIGDVTYRWNFGDGTTEGPGAPGEVTHTYQSAGHYTVIAVATDAEQNRTSTSWVQTVHAPLTEAPPSNSGSIVFDAQRGRVFSVNRDAGTVSALDAESSSKLGEYAVGADPRALAQAPDGSLWVVLRGSSELVVLSADDGSELSRIALPYAAQPHS